MPKSPSSDPNKEFRHPEWPNGLYRRGTGFFHWRRMVDGVRRSKSLGTRKLTVAVKMAADLNEGVEDKGLSVKQVLAKGKVTVREAGTAYIESRGLRPRSAQRYEAILDNIARLGEEITGKSDTVLSGVDDYFVAQYIARRSKELVSPNGNDGTKGKRKGAKPKTISLEITLLKSVLAYSVTRGWLPSMPVITTKVAGFKSARGKSDAVRPLTDDEIPKLLNAAKAYDKQTAGHFPYKTYFHDILTTYIYAGLRHEELKFLEWTDIDFRHDVLRVRSKAVKCHRTIPLPKDAAEVLGKWLTGKNPTASAFPDDPKVLDEVGGYLRFKEHDALKRLKVRDFDFEAGLACYSETLDWGPKASEGEVPLHPRLRKILESLKGQAPSNFVFPDSDGGYWRMRFERHLHRIVEIAEIDDFTRVHDLRHTTGMMLRRNGVPLETIKEILRHQNIEDTLIYARYDLEEGKKAIAKLPTW